MQYKNDTEENKVNLLVTNPDTEYLNKSVMYQMFLRAFTPEGTLKSAERMLPYLADLGIDIVYLCPCFKEDADTDETHWSNRQRASKTGNPKNPYRMSDYFSVDEEYGTNGDLGSFVAKAHSLGIRVALDLVYFHCGPRAVFLEEHPEFVMHDENGNIEMGEWHFPKLNFENDGLREYLWDNMCYYIREYDIDGYRCDVGPGVPLDFWEEGRRRMNALKKEAFLLDEGTAPHYIESAFDLNYETGWGMMLFKCMIADMRDKKIPNGRKYITGEYVGETTIGEQFELRDEEPYRASKIPEYWQYRLDEYKKEGVDVYRVIRGVDNHDTVSDEYELRKDALVDHNILLASLAFCILIDGVPFLYNGVEFADSARHSLFSNREYGAMGIDWSTLATPEGQKRYSAVKKLIDIRHRVDETSHGNTEWLEVSDKDSVCAFARTKNGNRTVVYANFTSKPTDVVIDCGGEYADTLFENDSRVTAHGGGKITVSLLPHGCGVVRVKL